MQEMILLQKTSGLEAMSKKLFHEKVKFCRIVGKSPLILQKFKKKQKKINLGCVRMSIVDKRSIKDRD